MSGPLRLTSDALESLLADLDDQSFVAFVVDLYERTGYDTERHGNVVTAVAPGEGPEDVLVWTDDRTRIERLLGSDPPDPDVEEIDTVVSRDQDTAAAAGVAETLDADHLGTGTLHDRLLYAMNRDTCRDLCQTHFDRAVEPRPAPPENSEYTPPPDISRGGIALAGLVLCGLIAVGVAGLPGAMTPEGDVTVPGGGTEGVDPPEPGPVTPVGGQGATPTPTPSPPSTDRTPVVTSTPPGILPPSITNATVVDLEDGDGVVSSGDRVAVSASVTDDDSDLAQVFAIPEQFGVERIELTSAGGDLYTGTFVVEDEFPAVDGSWRIPILAEDTTGSFADAVTGPLAVIGDDEESAGEGVLPTVTNATVVDLEDGDGVVSDGDRVVVRASVADNASDAKRVDAFPGSFGVESPLPMTDPDDDGVYNTTFQVDATQADRDGAYTIGVGAVDETDNVNFPQVFTNELELNTSEA